MPGTIRGLLQGIGAALPQIAAMMERESARELEERRVKALEEQVELEGIRVGYEGQRTEADVDNVSANTARTRQEIDMNEKAWDIRERAMRLANRGQELDNMLAENDYALQSTLFQDTVNAHRLNVEKLQKELGQIDHNQLMDKERLEMERIGFVLNVMGLSAELGFDPEALGATFEADTPQGMLEELPDMNLSPAQKMKLNGTLNQYLEANTRYQAMAREEVLSLVDREKNPMALPEATALVSGRYKPLFDELDKFFGVFQQKTGSFGVSGDFQKSMWNRAGDTMSNVTSKVNQFGEKYLGGAGQGIKQAGRAGTAAIGSAGKSMFESIYGD